MGNQTSIRIPTQPPRPASTVTLLREKAQGCSECTLVFPRNGSVANVTATKTATNEVILTPSLPFTFEANGTTVTSHMMRLFHPCPFKVNNIQYDAVLILESRENVVLILPIQGSSVAGGQGVFFSNFVPRLTALSATPVSIPTGSTWNLTTLIPLNDRGNPLSGYFSWKGIPSVDLTHNETGVLEWEPTEPVKRYICMENPALMSSMDLQVVTSLLAPRDVEKALPRIPTSYMYVPPCSTKRETFVPFREYFEAGCDPLQPGQSPAIVKDFFYVVPWFVMVIAAFILIHFWIRYLQGPFVLLVTRIGQALGRGLRQVFEGQKIQQNMQGLPSSQ